MGIVAFGHVGLRARDVDALTRFYRDTVGLQQTVDVPGRLSIFAVGDADFYLEPGEPLVTRFDFASDDIDALRASLVGRGVSCTQLKDEPASGHRVFAFEDLEGNTIGVCTSHPPRDRPPA